MKTWIGVVAIVGCDILVGPTPGSQGSDSQKEFAGSEKWRGYHSEEFTSWKASFHAKIIQPRKGGILKDAVQKWKNDSTNPGLVKGNATGTQFTLDDAQYVVG